MGSPAHNRATIKYAASNTKQIKFVLNLKTDADILKHLETIGNKQGYIKDLIRRDMNK